MYVKHLSSLQFLTYVAFFAVVVAAICGSCPGTAPPRSHRAVPRRRARRATTASSAKYFVAGGAFLVLGSLHMVVKNLPWTAEWLARAGYAGHLVRDLSNTHLMIVGGGTLIATGLTWYALPRIVGRPLTSDGLAQCAFWFTARRPARLLRRARRRTGSRWAGSSSTAGTTRRRRRTWASGTRCRSASAPGVMGLGYWCFAANVVLTDLPVAARARAEAAGPPVEVPRHRRGRR